MPDKVYVQPGQRVRVIGSYSEVMVHFGLAGRPIEVELLAKTWDDQTYYSAQVYKDGQPFSGAITTGEAGFYQDDGGFYTYQDDGPGDENPDQILREMHNLIEEAFKGVDVKVIK